MTSSVFAVKPKLGLCNRLRAVVSAKTLADAYNLPLEICWTPSNGFDHTHLNELFQTDFCFIDEDEFVGIGKEPLEIDYYTPRSQIKKMLKNKRCVVTTCVNMLWRFDRKDLFDTYLRNLRSLKPVDAAQSFVDGFAQEHFRRRPIGVHVRRGDATAKEFRVSSDDAFMRLMRGAVANNDNTRFFMATDCEDTLELFKEHFGERLIYWEKSFTESNLHKPKLQQSWAFLEFLLLSKCRKIIGTNWSSFSETAAHYGGSQLIIAKNPKPGKTRNDASLFA